MGGRGAGRVFVGNWGGGGPKYFFSGPKFPPSSGCGTEGAQFYLLFRFSGPFFSRSEASFFSLKTCTPVKVTP